MRKQLLKKSVIYVALGIICVLCVIGVYQLNCSANIVSAKSKEMTFLELCANGAKKGSKVKTSGYAKAGDGGAATYLIDGDKGDGSIADIPIKKGLYAHLQYSGTVNVASVGILPETECSEELNSAIEYFAGKAETLQFNSGKYCFSNQVFLKSINLYGDKNTVFCVNSDFNPLAGRVFLTDIRKHDEKYDIKIEKINFLYETSKHHSLHDKEMILLALSDINYCRIYDCSFVARHADKDGDYMKCDLLWFQESNSKNINVEKSSFKNLTGVKKDVTSDEKLVGGCIWFSGRNPSSEISDIVIKDCDIETTLTDEAIAVWDCKCKNMTIDNCKIKNSCYYSHNVLNFYDAAATDVKISGCTFSVTSPAYAVVKIYSLFGVTDILFESCVFEIDTTANGHNMDSIIWTNDFEKKYYSSAIKKVSLSDCTFISKGDDKFECLLNIYHAKNYLYTIKDCKVNASFNSAVASAADSNNCSLEMVNTPIDTNKNPVVTSGFVNCMLDVH